jgi:hypothetical protein
VSTESWELQIAVATEVGGLGSLLGPLGEALGDGVRRPLLGSLLSSPNGYPAQGAAVGFILSSVIGGLPIPDLVVVYPK